MKKLLMMFMASAALVASAARNGPWTKEQAWEWYSRQPWMRGCNYMPASCANRVDQWQEMGCEVRLRSQGPCRLGTGESGLVWG